MIRTSLASGLTLSSFVCTAFVAACGSSAPAPTATFTRAELMDPVTCQQCHAQYFTEWSGSMHAYASKDPVFRAMNARGQRETNGQLGNFCVKCHAPLAVQENATTDGLNMDSVPSKLQGITCYFCHQVTEVQGTHNNPLVLANDTTMRGGVTDPPPLPNPAHHSAYSNLLDGNQVTTSSSMCGSCHDIVVPAHFSGASSDVHLEKTYEEYQASLFSKGPPANKTPLSCGNCHMGEQSGEIASAQGLKVDARVRHTHEFPGVDLALTDFPHKAEQLAGVKALLTQAMTLQLCVDSTTHQVTLQIENIGAGHKIPSGASQDRRMWVELHASKKGTEVYSSGAVPAGTAVTDLNDPDLWLFRDVGLKKDGSPAHMFWDVASIDESPTQRQKPIPATLTLDSTDQTRYHVELLNSSAAPQAPGYEIATAKEPIEPDTISVTLHMQPVGRDVLNDLVKSGDLPAPGAVDAGIADAAAPNVVAEMPTIDIIPNPGDGGITTTLLWTPALATNFGDTGKTCVSNAGELR